MTDTPLATDITISDYPELQLLCWNRSENVISRKDAFALYESHWHLLSTDSMAEHETQLIKALADQYGEGLINA